MAEHNHNTKVDIAIHGAGIAGLWTLNRLKALGYSVILLETNAIGGGQSVSSQGIIHSGLKYALAGKVNDLARTISAMPERWRACLNGSGEINLSAATLNAPSQQLLIPAGFMGGITKLIAGKSLEGARTLPEQDWPEGLGTSGFNGSAVLMNEPVLDIPSVIKALAEPHKDNIRKSPPPPHSIEAQLHIYTAAAGNERAAQEHAHDKGLKTQKRPLLMAMMKPAPFPLYAHLVGTSEKPVASITTHHTEEGPLVWYIGGGVAERSKNSAPQDLFKDTAKALKKYLPDIDLTHVEWAALPIDRVEGAGSMKGWLPDTPTIHEVGNTLYCWPTKLTFAPLLADIIIEKLEKRAITPTGEISGTENLIPVDYASPPWDKTTWTQ